MDLFQASPPPTAIPRRPSPPAAGAGEIGNALSRRSCPPLDAAAAPPAEEDAADDAVAEAPTAAPGPYDLSALRARMSMIGPSKRVKAFSPRVATRNRPSPGLARTVAARGAELMRASSARMGAGRHSQRVGG